MQRPPSKKTLVLILRCLLVTEIACYVIGIPLQLWSSYFTDELLIEAGFQTPDPSQAELVVSVFGLMILVVSLPCSLVSWVGLFNFWGPSRWIYLGNAILLYVGDITVSIFDFSFHWSLPDAILQVSGPIEGAIIALIFLSSVAKEFETEAVVTATVVER